MPKYVRINKSSEVINKVSSWVFKRMPSGASYPAPKEVLAFNKKIMNVSNAFILYYDKNISEDFLLDILLKSKSSISKISCERKLHPVQGEYLELFVLLNKGKKRSFFADIGIENVDIVCNLTKMLSC